MSPESASRAAAALVCDLRFQRLVQRVYAGGVRTVAEALAGIAVELDAADTVERMLEEHGRFGPELLTALGADRFPPMPIREVA